MPLIKKLLSTVPLAPLILGMIASTGASAPNDAQTVSGPRLSVHPEKGACAKVARLSIEGGRIDLAREQVPNAPVEGVTTFDVTGGSSAGLPVAGLPGFCRVAGRLHPETGSDIAFEVWLPTTGWDGRFQGVGIGGFAGYIDYLNLSLAVRAGQAAVATDTGHRMTGDGTIEDAAWAKGHPERVRDYGWRAIHLSTVAAKQIIQSFYGRGPQHSFFVGCSGGGRQGLIEASRFPEDYDGILAGAPAANFTDLAIAMINPIQAQLAPHAAIRPDQLSFIQNQVVEQCDAVDGQTDGLIADPRQCKLDVVRLMCAHSASSQCLSLAQTVALEKIYAGPNDASGRRIAGGYLPAGAETSSSWLGAGWDSYIVSHPGHPSGAFGLANGILQGLVQAPFATTANFDFSKDPARLKAALSSDTDASPDLTRFFARGGKLILWHGWADAAIPPEATLRYHAALTSLSGAAAQASTRLYMVPNVQHCAGGTGPDSFGQANAPQPGDTPANSMVAALQAWVEDDRRPKAIAAHYGTTGIYGIAATGKERQRLLCAWPLRAELRAGGDPNKAADYNCTGTERAEERP